MKNMCMCYQNDTLLISKDLDISIEGGERITVVRRTRSGKGSQFFSVVLLSVDKIWKLRLLLICPNSERIWNISKFGHFQWK